MSLKRNFRLNLDKEKSAITDTRQPHYYRDLACIAHWDTATVTDPAKSGEKVQMVSGKALWGAVKTEMWNRCLEINEARLKAWRNKLC